ncbi:hypothetical protein ABW19_dt0208023 [Dactylella cylindrospora]|nr:hypothetical protein ABW19_dt0208023 [Dactylella cylindrospora]
MLPVRSIAARTTRLAIIRPAVRPLPLIRQYASAPLPQSSEPTRVLTGNPEVDDPGMNDGYSLTQPPPLKRQFRDPYEKWWDPQERRNYGEAVHEDEDTLGIFSVYEYTAATPKKAAFLFSCFVGAVLGLSTIVYSFYPDKPAVPREFPDNGLEHALGGKAAVLARPEGSY